MISQVESTRLSTSASRIGELLDAFQMVQVLLGRTANRPAGGYDTESCRWFPHPQETETLVGLDRTPLETLKPTHLEKSYCFMPEGHVWADGERAWRLRRSLVVEFTEENDCAVATLYGETEEEYGEGPDNSGASYDLLTSLSDSLDFLEAKKNVLAPESMRELTWLRGLVVPA